MMLPAEGQFSVDAGGYSFAGSHFHQLCKARAIEQVNENSFCSIELIYLFYQFSVGQTLDRDSKSSPMSGSVWVDRCFQAHISNVKRIWENIAQTVQQLGRQVFIKK